MLRTRLLLIAAIFGCGFDAGGDGESGSTGSSSSEGDATNTSPTTTAPTTSVTMTTGPGTDTTTTESTETSADTGTETSTTEDPDSSGSESTGNPQQWGPFEDIAPIEEINDMFAADDDPTLTGDMLEIYFNTNRLGQEDIFVARRESVDDPFDTPILAVELSSVFIDTVPELSHDGLVMMLSNNSPGGAGGFDAFISTREDTEPGTLWSMPERVDELNTMEGDGSLSMTDDMLTAVLCRNYPGLMDYQLMSTSRRSTDDPWDEPVTIDALLSDGRDCSPWLTADGSELWFGSSRPDADSIENIYRVAMDGLDPDGDIEEVTELSSDAVDDDPWLSPDGSVIVFASSRDGQLEIYTATRQLE
jgi:hypothetical protein